MNSMKSTGGGVAIAIKKCFQSERVSIPNTCEDFWIRIALENLNLYLCCVYPPHSAQAKSVDDMLTQLKQFSADWDQPTWCSSVETTI
jgi:hypothetical protein